MAKMNVINLMRWIEAHQEVLKPPVGNKEIYPEGDFIVMVVAGPNARKDYHFNEGPEFFYQIKGDIVLKVVEDGEFRDITIREGEIYMLNRRIPHSPQRPAGSIGLVIEERRRPEQTDGFIWYCDNCHEKLHEVYLKLKDIEKQLPEVFKAFKENKELHKCRNCGAVLELP
ncbi:3-hydroxyanthranilate 3,4-dioxygenase [Thermonema lapsum]|uniref:3-hydroxyanthranilate 3,4-dioxygenase n=1 Tax=Thermonema lapsum TaxID=28195 RepID=A0A846MSS2_9BACT|nr:3-hydroxyanthranilate 3,4-dioxygenase [Thermonema lapsum]NIK74613.1 3-hydroxyanthranilate 3,4-dioxygenase [Thermonema lapsum]